MKKEIDQLLANRPDLKARDIARELGKERKAVNSFLYDNPEHYAKNDDHEWRLVGSQELHLVLPGKWVTGSDFEDILCAAGPVIDSSQNGVLVVFSANSNMMIECTARLLALLNQLARRGRTVTLDFSAAEGTRTYLDRAGFFDLLDRGVTVLPHRPTHSAAKRHQGRSHTLVEFGMVNPNGDNHALIDQLTEKFIQQTSDKYTDAAYTVFSELIGNVSEHSDSPLAGFAGLQRYRGRQKHIQTVVSDSGVGIANTLRPALSGNYPQLYKQFGHSSIKSDMGLVKAAMSEVRVSRFGGARGLGFESSRQKAVKFDARFSVRQEEFCLEFMYRNGLLVEVRQRDSLRRLSGTHICFDFDLERSG